MTVTASPPTFSGGTWDPAVPPRTFGPCTVLVAGGSGSYTFAWTIVSTNSSVIFSSLTTQITNITVTGIADDTSYSIVRCTVTDVSTGAIALVDVLVQYSAQTIS